MNFVLGLITVFSLSFTQDPAIDRLIQNQQYQKALQAIEALDSAQQILLVDKKGYCAYQLGLMSDAKEAFSQMLHVDSFHVQANLYMSLIYEAELNTPKAIFHMHMLTEIDSLNAYYYKKLGTLYLKTGLHREAKSYFVESLDRNRQDISTWQELVDIANGNKNWSEADSLASIVLEMDSMNIRGILSKARAKYGLKSYEEVAQCIEQTKGRLDISPYYQKILGYAYLQIDSLDKSIKTLENLLYREQSEHTYYYLAMAHGKKENWEKASFYYEKAVNAGLSGNLVNYFSALAVCYKEQQNWPAALDAYDEAYYYDPEPIHLLRKAQLAEWYYKDKAIAIRLYQKGMARDELPAGQVTFAKERIKALREIMHLSKK